MPKQWKPKTWIDGDHHFQETTTGQVMLPDTLDLPCCGGLSHEPDQPSIMTYTLPSRTPWDVKARTLTRSSGFLRHWAL